jgi:hypothetical protein
MKLWAKIQIDSKDNILNIKNKNQFQICAFEKKSIFKTQGLDQIPDN